MQASQTRRFHWDCARIADRLDDPSAIAELSGWASGTRVYRVPDVRYFPKSRVQIALECVPEEGINYPDHLELGRKRFERGDESAAWEDLEFIDEEVCILGNICARNFTHWTEELLKVVLLEHYGFDGRYVLAAGLPEFCRDSLDVLGISSERISVRDRPCAYKAGFYTTNINHFCAHRFPMVFRHLRERLHTAVPSGRSFGPRVWVDRKDTARKFRVLNREEVLGCIERYGFVPVDFAEHSFRDQIAIDREITGMAGPHGSGFAHCQFIGMKSNVVELFSPHYNNVSYVQLCKVMGHSYHQIVSAHVTDGWPFQAYGHGKNLMVDIDHLELVLDTLYE